MSTDSGISETGAGHGGGYNPSLLSSTDVPLNTLLHHAGTLRSRDPLVVESLPDRWVYTVSFPLQTSQASSGSTLPLVVTADVTVHEGELGALLVAKDLTTPIARLPPAVGTGRHTIELLLEAAEPLSLLVFRNHTRGSRSCVFTVESVSLRPATSEALAFQTSLSHVTTGEPPRIDIGKLRYST